MVRAIQLSASARLDNIQTDRQTDNLGIVFLPRSDDAPFSASQVIAPYFSDATSVLL